MKKTIITIIFTFILINIKAQAPNWTWAKSAGNSGNDKAQCTATDASGNIYVTGSYTSSSITIGATTLINIDTTGTTADIFIVKYDAAGNIIWVKGAGSIGDDVGNSLTTDSSGNVYITGYYVSSIIFGTTTLTNAGNHDVFVVKYDAFGNVLWAKGSGSAGIDVGRGISIDATGNVCVTGSYTSTTITFGANTLTNSDNAGNTSDLFIVKYDTSGNIVWANDGGSTGNDLGNSITTDSFNNVYVTGSYSYSISFDTIILTNWNNNLYYDIFIVKYGPSGNILWAKSAGHAGNDLGISITKDNSNNIYITGYYYSASITFGATSLLNVDSAGIYPDIFIVKYDASGNVIWAKSEGSSSGDFGESITTDAFGNVYVIGNYYSSSIIFGATTLTNASWSSYTDVFVVKYNDSGNVIWAKGFGSTTSEALNGITTDASGNVYITGSYTSPSISLGATTLSNSGSYGYDMFIAKLDATAVGIEENIFTQGIYIYPNPSNGMFTLKSTDLKLQNCSIYNVLGECVFSQNSNLSNQINIDLSAQAKGIYFVQMTNENRSVTTKKIIVQ